MFQKFRIKIVIVIMCVLTVLLTSILTSIYVASSWSSKEHTNYMLLRLCRRDGFDILSRPRQKNEYNSSQYYLVLIGSDGSIQYIHNDNSSGYTDEQLGTLAITLSEKIKHKGTFENFSYYVDKRIKGTYVAFSNDDFLNSYLNTLFKEILVFGMLGLILFLLASLWLSKWLVTPLQTAFAKQKQFISDASHEMKTPVAVISANADALQREIGENKWLGYIRDETQMMNKLINDLLQLAAIDSGEGSDQHKKVNLSEIVLGNVLPFESVAFERQIKLSEQIEEEITITGDSTKLGQLTAILVDNAINHTAPNGQITVTLKRLRDKRVLTVANIGKEIPLQERELIFERFYRADKARVRGNGNYGLGLAIAKSIVENHNGRISVACRNHWTTFKVVL